MSKQNKQQNKENTEGGYVQDRLNTYLSNDESKEIWRTQENPDGQKVLERVRITNRTYTLRKQTEERRNWEKFGEVKDLKRGEHKQGDFLIGGTIKVETQEGQEQEIEIVKIFSNLSTAQLKKDREDKKIKKMQELEKSGKKEEEFQEVTEKKSGLRNMLEKFKNIKTDISICLKNLSVLELARTQDEQDDLVQEFREFLGQVIGPCTSVNRYKSSMPRARRQERGYEVRPFRDLVYIEFPDEGKAQEAIDKLDGANFQNCFISADFAQSK